ncbi:rab3 GTPase activating protein catalytic subunit [Echinococcus multilocularis]|uniref:Rab3 GTPase activating protein catalytic subunit n=1 Tax=Echinococcus multilocularis TaxID=6211 RepID=A0A068XXW0_ECHMU|nr:rab3 GTPase activating protein catalytic subunit [Echinococcus multilocularis]
MTHRTFGGNPVGRLFKEKLPEDRFEDFTNATPWEKFNTKLQIILLDWQKSSKDSLVISEPISSVRCSVASFDTFEFKVEHFVVHSVASTKYLDNELTRVLLVASSYNLDEFILISPADPKARRLVGTTRIRLLLSSIEMALAASACELPLLVSYGNDKLYYGLRLSRGGSTTNLSPSEVFVPDSGLKKIEYAMSLTSLPHKETHLARLRDIFLEKVGSCEATPNVSVLQYFRMVKLKFQCSSHPHTDANAQFVFSPEQVFSEVSLNIEINLLADAPNLHSHAINDDPEFRLVNLTPMEWSVDCVLAEVEQCLLDAVYHVITRALDITSLPTNMETPPPEVLCSDGMKSLLDASAAMPGMPAAYFSPEVPSSEALDDHLTRTLGCRYTGAAIHTLLIALHLLILRLRSSDFLTAIAGAWYGFLSHLRCTPNCELFPISNVGECSSPVSSIDRALYILCQHPKSTSSGHTSLKDSEEEFFDALEDQVVHHAGPTAQYCPVCRSVFEELEGASPSSIAKWIAPYVLAHHINLFHRFVLPSALTAWYCGRLRTLRDEVSERASDQQSSFQAVRDFHRRTLCAVSLNTFFKYCDSVETLQPLAYELANRLHSWNAYQPSRLSRIECFNISRVLALPLSPEVRPLFVEGLVNTFGDSPQIPSRVPVCLSKATQLSKAGLTIHAASLEPFPVYRLVTISPNQCLRRPNRKMSGPSQQRLFVCIRNTPTTHEDSISLKEKLHFIRSGQGDCSDLPTDKDRDEVCNLYFAGCFGEDCDIG